MDTALRVMEYFSEKELGPKARTSEAITHTVWAGIVVTVQKLAACGAFGLHFPLECLDGRGTVGTDEKAFGQAAQVEVPGLDWPLVTERQQTDWPSSNAPYSPDTLVILDFVQFC